MSFFFGLALAPLGVLLFSLAAFCYAGLFYALVEHHWAQPLLVLLTAVPLGYGCAHYCRQALVRGMLVGGLLLLSLLAVMIPDLGQASYLEEPTRWLLDCAACLWLGGVAEVVTQARRSLAGCLGFRYRAGFGRSHGEPLAA